jgi:hypothetical protein
MPKPLKKLKRPFLYDVGRKLADKIRPGAKVRFLAALAAQADRVMVYDYRYKQEFRLMQGSKCLAKQRVNQTLCK